MINEQELYHYGVMGMKWGRRRYQNRDGSLTNAGKRHYEKDMNKLKAEKKKLRNEERTKKKIQKLKALESEVDTMKKKSKQPEKKRPLRKHRSRKELGYLIAQMQKSCIKIRICLLQLN